MNEVSVNMLEGLEAYFNSTELSPFEVIHSFLDSNDVPDRSARVRQVEALPTRFEPRLGTSPTAYFDRLETLMATTISRGVSVGEFPGSTDCLNLAAMIVTVIQGGYAMSLGVSNTGAMVQAAAGARELLKQARGTVH
ncbi:MAG: hypothetical protein JKY10_08190 [Cohaesibacteraceae bacterium]|nr:hypothetical protein [Cohaesibacteraceae bacterium]